MSFQEIKLPHFVVSELYSNVLIESDEKMNLQKPVTVISPDNDANIKILGENKKNISILVNDSEAVYLSDDKLDLITKLLTACKLTLADVAIINTHHKQITYNQVESQLNPQYILLFGINATQFKLPIIFPEYRVQQYDNRKMLIAADLSQMLGNTEQVKIEKSKLWLSLRQMFGV